MLIRVDFTQEAFRWLYQPLYKRVIDFYLEFGDSLQIAKERFNAIVMNDPTVFLLLKVDENDITNIQGHCLFSIRQDADTSLYAVAEQIKVDSGHDKTFVEDCFEYLAKYTYPIYPVKKISIICNKDKYRAYEKKYNFKVEKVLMSREVKPWVELEQV